MQTQDVKFSALVLNASINARNGAAHDVSELAASIAAIGLVQPLTVRKAGRQYEIIDGKRRYLALKVLVGRKEFEASGEVPVLVREDEDAGAREASLAANILHKGLTPVEEARAFARMLDDGADADTVAAHFGARRRFVEQRVAIGRLPKPILEALHAGEIDVKTAEAFTLARDEARQLKVWKDLKSRGHVTAWLVREALLNKAISAASAPALFIGADAYKAVGGEIVTDLFGKEEHWQAALVQKLVTAKLKETEAALKQEGWGSIKVLREPSDYHNLTAEKPRGKPAPEQEKRLEQIGKAIARLEKKLDKTDVEDLDLGATHDEIDALEAERETIERSLYTEKQKAALAVVIDVRPVARPDSIVRYGMASPKAAKAAKAARKRAGSNGAGEDASALGAVPSPEEPDFTGALLVDLSHVMQGAVALAMRDRPERAFNATVAAMAFEAAGAMSFGLPLNVALAHEWGGRHGGEPQAPEREFDDALADALKPFAIDGEDTDFGKAIRTVEELDGEERVRLAALLFARRLAIIGQHRTAAAQALIDYLAPDVGAAWTPDEAFYKRLTRPQLEEALAEAQVNYAGQKKKAEFVQLCVDNLKGWLPKPLRTAAYQGPGSNAWADARGAAIADAHAPSSTPIETAAAHPADEGPTVQP